ncbi:MAG: hypothetical protein WBC19_09690 [Pyrinomonadaceae bacterium]
MVYDIFIYAIAILWSVGIPFTALHGIFSLRNFEYGSSNWKIGILMLCRVPLEILTVLLLLYFHHNEFDSMWTVVLPGILMTLEITIYLVIRAAIIHGSLRKGVIIEMNFLFSDLAKEKGE